MSMKLYTSQNTRCAYNGGIYESFQISAFLFIPVVYIKYISNVAAWFMLS